MQFNKLKYYIILLLIVSGAALNGADFKPGQVYYGIKDRKVIRIGVAVHYPPLSFNSGEKGVEIKMCQKLGRFLGVKTKLIPLNVSEFISAIENKRVDIVIAGMSKNLERGKRIWFSRPYLNVTPGVLILKRVMPQTSYGEEFEQSPVKTIWDLKKIGRLKLAVKKGSSYETLLKNRLPDMAIRYVKTNEEGLRLLRRGAVHGFVHDSLFLQYLYRSSARYRSGFVLIQGGSRIEALCAGLPFGDMILKNQIDLFLSELIREGYIEEWLKIYNRQ